MNKFKYVRKTKANTDIPHESGVLCFVLRAPPLVGNEPWNWVSRVESQFKAWMVSKFTEHCVKDGEAFLEITKLN